MMFCKRFYAFFVCLLLLAGSFLFQAGAADDPVLSADFEEASGFDTVAGTFSLPGGSVRIFNDGFYRAETDENHGRYMIWECETPGKNTYVPVTLTVRPTVDYVLSLDFRYEELAEVKAGQCTLNLIQLYSLSPAKEWYNLINMEADGTLFAYSGGRKSDAERLELGRLDKDTWYTLEVLIDVSTEQYALRVNGGTFEHQDSASSNWTPLAVSGGNAYITGGTFNGSREIFFTDRLTLPFPRQISR